jgi:peptidoglycan/xylan/chitin deacetylase (PgdA/CDA1 family)
MDHNLNPRYSVHVDCDNAWISENELGITKCTLDRDYLYDVALRNLLTLFDYYKIKATFFIVGRDILELKSCVNFCSKVINEGHKIGNHSFNHPINFGELNSIERKAEILDAHNIILEKLNYNCKSFRAPGYGVSNNDLFLLAKNGYIYDSSILPGFATLIMKLYVVHIKNFRKKSFCVWENFFASTKSKKYRFEDKLNIWRIPISILPFLRLPFHTSFLFSLSLAYTKFSIAMLKINKNHKIILFHGLDLSEQTNGNYKSIIPAFNTSYQKRFGICNELLNAIKGEVIHIEDILN